MGFGNGAFQNAKIAIDNYTLVLNDYTGKVQAVAVAPSANSSVTTIPVLITNTEATATPAPFQQMIQTSNLSQFTQIASDLSNVYFSSDQAGQDKLYSWRQSGTSPDQTVTWWILLPNGIPANSSITIYLQVSSSSAIDGVYTGVAPNLTSTYGQYDNGAKVFTNYENFAGTALPSSWTAYTLHSGSAITVNNGITIQSGSGGNGGLISNWATNPASTITEMLLTSQSTNNGQIQALVASSSSTSFGYLANSIGYQNGSGLEAENNNGGTPSVILTASLNPGLPAVVGAGNNVLYVNGQSAGSLGSGTILGSGYVAVNVNTGTSASLSFYSIMQRAYPPNGVMPKATVNIQSLALLNSANTWTATQTFNAGIKSNVPQTTLTGTTAGSIVYSMPEQGSSYKKVIVYLDAYENDTAKAQTYTFPVAFTNTPVISTNSANIPGVTVSTTTLSLAPDTTTAYTGWIIVEGY